MSTSSNESLRSLQLPRYLRHVGRGARLGDSGRVMEAIFRAGPTIVPEWPPHPGGAAAHKCLLHGITLGILESCGHGVVFLRHISLPLTRNRFFFIIITCILHKGAAMAHFRLTRLAPLILGNIVKPVQHLDSSKHSPTKEYVIHSSVDCHPYHAHPL